MHPGDGNPLPMTSQHGSQTHAGEIFCIELFAGSAGLTFAMKHFFKQSFGVDHKSGAAKARVVRLDLTIKANQDLGREWALSPQCLWVHSGVPCGTASKARQIRMSKKKHGPPPLRSVRWPLGLPGISGTALAKVRSANILEAFTCQLCIELDKAGKIWTLENPWSSLLWKTPYWKKVEAATRPFMVELDYCTFGGSRKKHTCLATNCSDLMALNIVCDNQHEHAPWEFTNGKFSTSEEAAYTPAFCKTVASTVFGAVSDKFHLGDAFEINKRLKLSAFPVIPSGLQPNKQIPPVVSEFAIIVSVFQCASDNLRLDSQQCLQKCLKVQQVDQPFVLPMGARLLRQAKSTMGGDKSFCTHQVQMRASKQLSDFSGVEQLEADGYITLAGRIGKSSLVCSCKCNCTDILGFDVSGDQLVFGIRWAPLGFVQQAVEVGHPMNIFTGISDEVCNAIHDVSSLHPAQIIPA